MENFLGYIIQYSVLKYRTYIATNGKIFVDIEP